MIAAQIISAMNATKGDVDLKNVIVRFEQDSAYNVLVRMCFELGLDNVQAALNRIVEEKNED